MSSCLSSRCQHCHPIPSHEFIQPHFPQIPSQWQGSPQEPKTTETAEDKDGGNSWTVCWFQVFSYMFSIVKSRILRESWCIIYIHICIYLYYMYTYIYIIIYIVHIYIVHYIYSTYIVIYIYSIYIYMQPYNIYIYILIVYVVLHDWLSYSSIAWLKHRCLDLPSRRFAPDCSGRRMVREPRRSRWSNWNRTAASKPCWIDVNMTSY